MRRILRIMTVALFLLLVVTACGSPDETVLPTQAAIAEIEMPVAPEETIISSTESAPIDAVMEEPVTDGERPLLPSLTFSADQTGLGSNITIAEETGADDTSMLAPNEDSLFSGTEIRLEAMLPANEMSVQVWRQAAVPPTADRAKAIGTKWGFSGSLYRFATLNDPDLGEASESETAPLPIDSPEFHLFAGARSLVVTEGASYYSDESVPFNYESPQPYGQRAPLAEATLQAMGLLDFPYTLADGWGHEVWVNRLVDGIETNMPEVSAGVDENGRLAFAAYQPFDQLTLVGTYPLISAESAWQQIQDGVDEDIFYSITSPEASDENLGVPTPSGFRYWPREYQTGQEIHLYTFPTVFLPVDEESAPLIQAETYIVQTDDETSRALAEQLGANIHFWGILDTNANSLALAGWEPVPALNPLIKNGTVQTEAGQKILVDQEGGQFILPNAPVDLADGSQVNVFAWAAREAGQAYPVLEWRGIDMQVSDQSGETIALPENLPSKSPSYEQIVINEVEVAYHVHPEIEANEDGFYQQTFWLLPVWQFTGLAENGDTLTFAVQATEQ